MPPGGTVTRSPASWWTWTTSRESTTSTGTPPATRCSKGLPACSRAWPATLPPAPAPEKQSHEPASGEPENREIPFHAVTALLSALTHRDKATALHSQRVADLCVAAAEGLLPASDCFLLEVAALLHDVGKLGVPDSILLKPGPLTDEDWKVM